MGHFHIAKAIACTSALVLVTSACGGGSSSSASLDALGQNQQQGPDEDTEQPPGVEGECADWAQALDECYANTGNITDSCDAEIQGCIVDAEISCAAAVDAATACRDAGNADCEAEEAAVFEECHEARLACYALEDMCHAPCREFEQALEEACRPAEPGHHEGCDEAIHALDACHTDLEDVCGPLAEQIESCLQPAFEGCEQLAEDAEMCDPTDCEDVWAEVELCFRDAEVQCGAHDEQLRQCWSACDALEEDVHRACRHPEPPMNGDCEAAHHATEACYQDLQQLCAPLFEQAESCAQSFEESCEQLRIDAESCDPGHEDCEDVWQQVEACYEDAHQQLEQQCGPARQAAAECGAECFELEEIAHQVCSDGRPPHHPGNEPCHEGHPPHHPSDCPCEGHEPRPEQCGLEPTPDCIAAHEAWNQCHNAVQMSCAQAEEALNACIEPILTSCNALSEDLESCYDSGGDCAALEMQMETCHQALEQCADEREALGQCVDQCQPLEEALYDVCNVICEGDEGRPGGP